MLDLSRGGFLGGGVAGGTVSGNLTMASGTQILIDDGAVGAPGLAFSTATSTGLYKNGTGVNIAGTGTQVIATTSSAITLSQATTLSSAFTANAHFRVAAETDKTGDYTCASDDAEVRWTGAGPYTATLPATPGVSQKLTLVNLTSSALAVARNGKSINGAASDESIAAGKTADLHYNGTSWRLMKGA